MYECSTIQVVAYVRFEHKDSRNNITLLKYHIYILYIYITRSIAMTYLQFPDIWVECSEYRHQFLEEFVFYNNEGVRLKYNIIKPKSRSNEIDTFNFVIT